LDNDKFDNPRNGNHDDKAHPPIHPVKLLQKNSTEFNADEWKVYDLITRHFLACVSKNAVGDETEMKIAVKNEKFHAKGI
jgi:DNA topoisomerase-3